MDIDAARPVLRLGALDASAAACCGIVGGADPGDVPKDIETLKPQKLGRCQGCNF